MNNLISDVLLFHKTFGHPVLPSPAIPSPERQLARNKFIRDEYIGEFDPAWSKCLALSTALSERELASPGGQHDVTEALAEMGDVIADLIYFLIGTAHEYGLPLQEIWDAVQTANMSKLWTREEVFSESGRDGIILDTWRVEKVDASIIYNGLENYYVVCDDTGKVRKPPSWKEPNIKAIIRKAMGCSTPSDQSTSS